MKHPKTYSLPASLSSSCSLSQSQTSPSKRHDTWSAMDGQQQDTSASSSSLHSPISAMHLSPRLQSDAFAALTTPTEFIELLAHSNFSFLQGASHPEELVTRAKLLGYKGIAVCDVNGMYGVVRGYQAAERPSAFDTAQLAHAKLADGSPMHEFKYLCGAELTPYDSSPITLLPMNKEGYKRLCHLITTAKRRAPKGHIVISLRDIIASNEDLIALPLPPWNEDHLKKLQDAFQDRIYLPVHKDFSWESIRFYQQAMKLEQAMGLHLFATQRPLFHVPERKPLHDVLTCILHKTTLSEAATRLTPNRERYLKTPQQIAFLFRERPDLIRRTLEIAARVNFSLTELRYRYPQEILPAGKTATEFLRDLVEKGLRWRYLGGARPLAYASDTEASTPSRTPIIEACNMTGPSHEEMADAQFMTRVRKQIEHELKLIQEMEYEDYFLTLWDICQFAASRGILHQGRGSAANSVVCFTLGLTSVDPIMLDLLFERFISRERGEPPDIDIDFEHERREEVIQYIYNKYGERRAAMVCTVISYRSRMAIREVAKVMGMPLPQIDALIKFMGREGLSRLLENPIDVAKFGLNEEKLQRLLRLALELQGFPRHLGIHTGGFVISNAPVSEIVPVESATMNGRYVIQWNKDDINILGLMKIDVLSLGMLTAVRKALELLKSHKGKNWNLAQIPHDDPGTYAMIQKADTVGVFQIESRAQMSLLPRLKPKNYYDLVIEVAIVRPGPIQGGMIHPYLHRRSGQEKVTYAHPSLKPILGKTLGVPLFQEQVMQVAVAVAGFTPGEADELRRVMSSAWKKKSIMDGLRSRVINGMLSNGLTREYAEQIYKTIEGFSSYGFPESHAASFALITYVSCYLKHHHPDVFTCALLNSQPMGFYSPRQLIADAQRHGVTFLPLDVQHSDWDYTLEDPVKAPSSTSGRPTHNRHHSVRTGLRSIYGLHEEQARSLVEERHRSGSYFDLRDFVRRTKLTRHVLVRLGAAGALASFGLSARESIWVIQGLDLDPQSLLFASTLTQSSTRPSSEEEDSEFFTIPFESDWQAVHREYATKGFSLESHPMSVLRPALIRSAQRYTTAKQLETLRHRTRVRIAGLMSLLQKPPTAKGMCFVSLEDETGLFNVIITPDIYQKHRLTLLHTALLEVDGWLESHQGVRNIKALTVRPLLRSSAQELPR